MKKPHVLYKYTSKQLSKGLIHKDSFNLKLILENSNFNCIIRKKTKTNKPKKAQKNPKNPSH